jgi:hypothetical protein
MTWSRVQRRAAFRHFVDQSVLAAVTAGSTTFRTLLRQLPSVYPTELLSSLDRLSDIGAVDPAIIATVHCEAQTRPTALPGVRSLLPLPHPVDFEWRFSADSARNVLNAAADLTAVDGRVLLFGTPGVAVEALSLPPSRRLFFLGEDNLVTRRLIALNDATGSPLSVAFCSAGLPRDSADAIILDPPWYMDFIRPMLAAASAACHRDGVVLICLPPAGARLDAAADHDALIRYAARLGLDVVGESPLALEYDTPFFEMNALAVKGIIAPPRWRRGDLTVFRKSRRPVRPVDVTSGRRQEWIEIEVRRMRLLVKPDSDAPKGVQGLLPLIEGDILPTVSRRDKRRSAVRVWTSGNRVFQTDNSRLVIEAALMCRTEADGVVRQPRLWSDFYERDAVERIEDKLKALAATEAVEEAEWITMESERMPWKYTSTGGCEASKATAFR